MASWGRTELNCIMSFARDTRPYQTTTTHLAIGHLYMKSWEDLLHLQMSSNVSDMPKLWDTGLVVPLIATSVTCLVADYIFWTKSDIFVSKLRLIEHRQKSYPCNPGGPFHYVFHRHSNSLKNIALPISNPNLSQWSLQKFAHVRTAELSWQVQNFVVNLRPETEYKAVIFIEFEAKAFLE